MCIRDRYGSNGQGYAPQYQGAGQPPNGSQERKYVILEEKYFRRVDKFDGDVVKFRGWLFDVLVAISQVDDSLGSVLKGIIAKGHDETWDPKTDLTLDQQIHQKFASELYGVIVSLTTGEAKNIVKSVVDVGGYPDGFKAIVLLCHRCDTKTCLLYTSPSPRDS